MRAADAGAAAASGDGAPLAAAMPPRLETDRLVLREWRAEDFGPFAAFFADPESARFVGGACDRAEAWRRLAVEIGHWPLRGYGMYVVEERAAPGFAGYVGLWNPEGWPELELGWCLAPSTRGRGLATEAADACRREAFRRLGIDRLVSFIHPLNAASKRVAERVGAVPEGTGELLGGPVEVWRHAVPAHAS